MKIFDIATVDPTRDEPGRNWYTVAPGDLYPAAIEYIQGQLAAGNQGDGIIRNRYYQDAAALPAAAWQLALTPHDEVEAEDALTRATALEIARLWFTELLHRALRWKAVGVEVPAIWGSEPPAAAQASLGLRIEKDEAWRL
jgi:hypothetical protein